MTKSLWVACVFLTFAIFVITQASASNETQPSEDYQDLKTYDVKTKGKEPKAKKSNESIKDAESNLRAKAKPAPKKYRIVLMGTRAKTPDEEKYRLPVEKITETVIQSDEQYKDRAKRNATVLKELKDAKKSQKKLKLAQSRTGYKNWKNKERPSDSTKDKSLDKTLKISKRQVDYLAEDKNRLERSARYAVTRNFKDEKYYAQRKAVMDRFYARQKEIAEKYARKVSTTPKYIYRYDIGEEMDRNNVSSTIKTTADKIAETGNASRYNDLGTSTTAAPTTQIEQIEETVTVASRDSRGNQLQITDNWSEDNVEEDESDDYDYYVQEDVKYKPVAEATLDENGTMNDSKWDAADDGMDTIRWGNCSGQLVYVHDLIIGVHNATYTDANASTFLEVPYCVTCIIMIPTNTSKALSDMNINRNNDNGHTNVVLTLRGFRDENLRYTLKIWGISKSNDRCDHV
ncbi:PREDICTED: uncharacterized protein LOC108553946 [Eufriesea mexicana]|uniref:uncharacterized protein LOC108553946 n=1 Tax=Eufriesea mexicana TaxID=516756 RepID=UPI00083C8FF3|nr:PREDICTED: uncharacterized protein LOC108553946 [Eufriesea mexicana]